MLSWRRDDVGDVAGDLTTMEQQDDKGGKASLWPLDLKHIVGPFHWRSICYYMLVYLGVLFRYVCQNLVLWEPFVGLAYHGKDIVFRFIIEYSSMVIGLFLYEEFWRMIFWLVLKLEISYRVIISWRILVSFRNFFWKLYFCMVKYLKFHNSSFPLRYFLM